MTLDTEDLLAWAERAAAEHLAAAEVSALPVIAFMWGKEYYALPVAEVCEVAKVRPITPLAGLPPTLLGAMNLRGEVLPVADLRPLLGLESGPPGVLSRLIVVADRAERVGLLVDAIGDIYEIITHDRSTGTSDLILGQTVLPDGRLVNLIDLNRALTALGEH